MFCINCGNQLNSNSKFCNKCGDKIGQSEKQLTDETLIDIELKRGIYKLENEDIAGAEKVFEDLALTHNVPMAWVYIGGIKLGQLDSGSTVQQALNCFTKAAELYPALKNRYQETYCNLSIQQIEKFCDYYLTIKNESKKAKKGRFWNALLFGASAAYGNQRNNEGNNIFRGAAGIAGSAYALHKIGEHSQKLKNMKNVESFLGDTIKQLIAGVKSYCSDNQNVYQNFLNKINQIRSNNQLSNLWKMTDN